ncbi:MAG TPA: DMT family transporter [Trebonia sp.]|nr:DMT family transporter [Trebonia sp.]
MLLAVLLSVAASCCTAASSICQRLGAASLPRRESGTVPRRGGAVRFDAARQDTGRFDPLLVFRLVRRPVWLLGFFGMLAGFACQLTALHFGPLALVQPILAIELLFVFGYLALRGPPRERRARRREWGAAIAMSAGISVFLRAAAPTGGHEHAAALAWWLAGLAAAAATAAAIAAAGGSPARRAACLGIATGIAWGFVAAVIKELSSHLAGGPTAIFATWSPYALAVTGAAAMLLTAHAMAAGPLAASQPGFTIGDPVTAILLGALLFGEHLGGSPAALAAEVAGLIVLAMGVWTLSGSELITETSRGGERRDLVSP